jgi:hypothetical protein
MRPLAVVVVLFVVLALLSPKEAVAGAPEKVPGAMKFDTVADGLLRYHKETDQAKRIRWLEKLAPTRDPRVAVALGEMMNGDQSFGRVSAAFLMFDHYVPHDGENKPNALVVVRQAYEWWSKNEHDLSRRASQTPR